MAQQPGPKPQANLASVWSERLLGLISLGIGILWVAGIAQFRDHELKPEEWLILVAGGFTLHLLMQRASRKKALPPMPEGARAMRMSALIAAIFAAMACIAGGILELVAQQYRPTEVPWGLRMLWHAACAFGFSYCRVLQRLLRVLPA